VNVEPTPLTKPGTLPEPAAVFDAGGGAECVTDGEMFKKRFEPDFSAHE